MGGERRLGLLLQHELAVDDDNALTVGLSLATAKVVGGAGG